MDDCQECGFANQQASSPYSQGRILAENVVKRGSWKNCQIGSLAGELIQ
jgi:hypothetical protein